MPRGVRLRDNQEERARGGAHGGGGEGGLVRRFLFLFLSPLASWDRRRRLLQKGVRSVQVSGWFSLSLALFLPSLPFCFFHFQLLLALFLQQQQERKKKKTRLTFFSVSSFLCSP